MMTIAKMIKTQMRFGTILFYLIFWSYCVTIVSPYWALHAPFWNTEPDATA